MIDVVTAYGLDVSGGTDNATKLQSLASDVDGWFKAGKPLPELRFTNGQLMFSHWPNFAYPNLHIIADGECRLIHTGIGNAVVLDGSIIGNSHEPGIDGLQFLGFKVIPNRGDAVTITACHRSRFDISTFNTPATAVNVRFCILGEFRIAAQAGVNGLILDCLPNGTLQTTACTFINPKLEGQAANGVWIKNAGACTFIGGNNRFFGVDVEGNQTDIYTGGGAHNNTFWFSDPSSLKWAGSWNITNRAM